MATPNNTPVTSEISIKEPMGAFMFDNTFINTISSYTKYFGDKYISAKASGKTVKVPKPVRAEVQGGRGVNRSGFNPTPVEEEEVDFTVDSWRGVQTEVSTLDLATDFDNDMNGVILNPYASDLATVCESDALEEAFNFGEAIVAPTTGVTFGNALDALAIIKENGGGKRDISCLAGQRIHGGMIKTEGDKFNPTKAISGMNYNGLVGPYAGLNWAVSENIPNWTAGTAADGSFDSATGLRPIGTVTATALNGVLTLAIEGIGTDGTITKGSKIYIADVNAVHPITRKDLGRKKGYAVQTEVTSSTNAVTVTLGDYFNDGSGTNSAGVTFQNVTALPTIGAIVYIAGEVSASYKQAMVYTKDTVGYAMISLTKPDGGAFYKADEMHGIKVRVIKDYTEGNDANYCTMDTYSGYKTLRPGFGVVMLQKIV